MPATASAPKAPAAQPASSGRRNVYLMGAAAGVLLVGLVIAVWAIAGKEDPRLNADTVTLVKFITTDRYLALPLEEQAPYMDVIETREDNGEIRELFESGQLSESEYRAALAEAWLGEQYKRSQRYASLPAGSARQQYVRDLLDKKQKRKKEKETEAAKSGGKSSPAARIKRDGAVEDLRIAAWPADARKRWEEFRKAYDAEKEARDAAAEAQAAQDAGETAGSGVE